MQLKIPSPQKIPIQKPSVLPCSKVGGGCWPRKESAPCKPAAMVQKEWAGGWPPPAHRVPREPCHHSREMVSHFGACCPLGKVPPADVLACRELMKCCKKFFWGMSYFKKPPLGFHCAEVWSRNEANPTQTQTWFNTTQGV